MIDTGLHQYQIRLVPIAHLFVVAVVPDDRDVEEFVKAAHVLLDMSQEEGRKAGVIPVLKEQ